MLQLSLWALAAAQQKVVKKVRTTLGLKGGVIFLALRSSQLMGEKNMWFLISICEGTQTTDC